jgi:hypothetical protein
MSDRIAELFPQFAELLAESNPEAVEAVLREDLSPEIAARRDELLLATAQLWQAWYDLGSDIRAQETPQLVM